MSEHTPGPWVIDDPYPGKRTFIRIASYEYDASGFGCQIAHIRGRWNVKYGEESSDAIAPMQEADARLIAAAPELLRVCMDAEDWIAEHGPGMTELLNELEAAIAKATGEESE